MIGDPSGRSTERNLLTRDEVIRNSAGIASDIRRIIPDVTVLDNYDWLGNMSFLDFVRTVGKRARVNHMLRLDSVKSRLDSLEGISFTEFSYPLLQAFDFAHLHKSHNVRVQVGGSDQWGNITMGSQLIAEDVAGVTVPLLTTASGEKIGKSAGNAVFLSPHRTSSYDFFQYFLRLDDATALKLLPVLTDLSLEQIQVVAERSRTETNLMQKTLAEVVTSNVRGKAELDRALRVSQFLFGSIDEDSLLRNPEELRMLFEDAKAPVFHLPLSAASGKNVVEVLVAAKAFRSKAAVRRLISDGGLSVNLRKVSDEQLAVRTETLVGGRYLLVRQGKKQWSLVCFE